MCKQWPYVEGSHTALVKAKDVIVRQPRRLDHRRIGGELGSGGVGGGTLGRGRLCGSKLGAERLWERSPTMGVYCCSLVCVAAVELGSQEWPHWAQERRGLRPGWVDPAICCAKAR